MSAHGITPARLVFDADGVPHAADYNDRYHPRIGAAAQARHVFLTGNHLPARWAQRRRFTIVETGFGLGNNFLATWDAWRRDPQRCERLHYVSVEAHPLTPDDLQRCHAASSWPELAAALQRAWPALTPGLHPIGFDDGRVQLLLAFGDVRAMLRELDVAADAFFLDGFAPDRNPAMWTPEVLRGLARHARDGATAATWSVARNVADGLRSAGFNVARADGIGGKREILHASFAPRFERRRSPRSAPSDERHALIVGAGLAGAWAAHALTQQGWRCTVFERHARPALEASGNPAGLFHGTLHGDDAAHARFNRAAALAAARALASWLMSAPGPAASRQSPRAGQGNSGTARRLLENDGVPGSIGGLLRVQGPDDDVGSMRARLAALCLPPDYVQALDAAQASGLAGIELASAAWYYPQGGWVDPAALVDALLRTPGVTLRTQAAVSALVREGDAWTLLDVNGQPSARAATVVLANAADALRLRPGAAWPLARARGQVSWWPRAPAGAPRPRLPLAGAGCAMLLPGGGLYCGATSTPNDDDQDVRNADHAFNIERLARLTGWRAPTDPAPQGRVAWRVQTPDRLPIVGPLAAADAAGSANIAGRPPTRLRDVEREPGLFALAALGSRGLTWAPLAGLTLAAWISGAPMPIEARLRDAIDPARWRVRAARRA